MKVNKRIMQFEETYEVAKIYLYEAERCLETAAGFFPEILHNPILGHAAFSTICMVTTMLESRASVVFWEKIEPGKFLYRTIDNGIEPEGNPWVLRWLLTDSVSCGRHRHVGLFRNVPSIQDVFDEGLSLGSVKYVLSLSDMIKRLFEMNEMIREAEIETKKEARDGQ